MTAAARTRASKPSTLEASPGGAFGPCSMPSRTLTRDPCPSRLREQQGETPIGSCDGGDYEAVSGKFIKPD